MNHAPVISRVLIVPGLSVLPDNSLQNVNLQSISVGLVIDDGRVVWGDYQPAAEDVDPLVLIQDKIVPVLEGRPLAAFREMMAALDELTETAVITQTISPPAPEKPTGAISRRGFLTGKLQSDPTTATTKQVTVERPIPAALRCHISQLLLTTLAAVRGQTITELIATEYNPGVRPKLVPMHLDIDLSHPSPPTALLIPAIQSLGYRITNSAQLGPDGAHLQRFIRQLTELIDRLTEADYRPTIHLDVGGSLGQLFDNNTGRILGALYGLEQVSKPYPLRIVDPALLADDTAQIALMRQLMDYVRLRRMQVQLAVNQPLQSLADVQTYIEAGAAHLLELSMSRLGTVQQTIRAIQAGQNAGLAVLLHDEGNTAVSTQQFISHLALASHPDLIMAAWGPNNWDTVDQIYRQMTRTITFFTQIRA